MAQSNKKVFIPEGEAAKEKMICELTTLLYHYRTYEKAYQEHFGSYLKERRNTWANNVDEKLSQIIVHD